MGSLISSKASNGLLSSTGSPHQRKDTLLHMVCASSREVEIDIASLTNLEKQEIILTAEQSIPPMAETQSGQQCLRKYDKAMPNSSKLTKEPAK